MKTFITITLILSVIPAFSQPRHIPFGAAHLPKDYSPRALPTAKPPALFKFKPVKPFVPLKASPAVKFRHIR